MTKKEMSPHLAAFDMMLQTFTGKSLDETIKADVERINKEQLAEEMDTDKCYLPE